MFMTLWIALLVYLDLYISHGYIIEFSVIPFGPKQLAAFEGGCQGVVNIAIGSCFSSCCLKLLLYQSPYLPSSVDSSNIARNALFASKQLFAHRSLLLPRCESEMWRTAVDWQSLPACHVYSVDLETTMSRLSWSRSRAIIDWSKLSTRVIFCGNSTRWRWLVYRRELFKQGWNVDGTESQRASPTHACSIEVE